QRFARARGTDQQDVRLRELDVVILRAGLEPLVMVVNGDGQDFFRRLLADHVLIEDLANLVRRRQLVPVGARRVAPGAFLANDVVAKLDAFIANEHRGARDEFAHLMLALAAKRAIEKLVAGGFISHLSKSAYRLRCRMSGSLYADHTRFCKTWSMIPYSFAASAHRKLSRS